MSPKRKLSAEEKEARRIEREQKAQKRKEELIRKEQKLIAEKKTLIYEYLAELTGTRDLSVTTLKSILGYEYTICPGEGLDNENLSVGDLLVRSAEYARTDSLHRGRHE